MKKPLPAAKALGKLGGKATNAKYGSDHYRRIALLAAIARKANREAASKLV